MQTNGWDTELPMLWGFFFCDDNCDKLREVFAELEGSNYNLENLYQINGSGDIWTLHVSKIDRLTPEKLYRRNLAFNELADYCGVACYDGWDVGRL